VSSSPVFKTPSPDLNTSDWLHVASSRMKATNSRLVWDSAYPLTLSVHSRGIGRPAPIPIMQYLKPKSFISRWIAFTDGPACLFAIAFNTFLDQAISLVSFETVEKPRTMILDLVMT